MIDLLIWNGVILYIETATQDKKCNLDLNEIVKYSPVLAEEEFISNYGQKFKVVCIPSGYTLLDPYDNKPNREQVMDAMDCAECIWEQITQIN